MQLARARGSGAGDRHGDLLRGLDLEPHVRRLPAAEVVVLGRERARAFDTQGEVEVGARPDVQRAHELDQVLDGVELTEAGSQTAAEFDRTVRDLVNFLDYMGEPIKQQRMELGVKVLLYLLALLAAPSTATAFQFHTPHSDPVAPVIDDLTGVQRVFLGYGQVWRRKYRDDELRKRIATDPHSPSEYRANGSVRNVPEWYTAFNVQESDALYLPPEERVRIW